MLKNTAGQSYVVFAFDPATSLPVTGDAANITANIKLDFGAANGISDLNPTETEGGFYEFTATQAETNADVVQVLPSSVTANVQVIQPGGIVNMYPETGIASSSQVDNIGAASGGAFNFAPDSDNVLGAIKGVSFVGVQTTGTFLNVALNPSDYHVIDDTAGGIDIVYRVPVGGGRTANKLTWTGYLTSANDTAVIQVYDGTTWDTISTIIGTNGTVNSVIPLDLLAQHTGTGADAGLVFIRLTVTGGTNPTLNTGQFIVSAVNIGTSGGYQLGAVWIDTINGNPGTEIDVNGTVRNPSSNIADATTIAASIGYLRFMVAPASSITLTQTYNGFVFTGENSSIDLGGQDVGNTHFVNISITGIGTGASAIFFDRCNISALTSTPFEITNSSLSDAITLTSAGNYIIADSHSSVASVAPPPSIDTGAAVASVNLSMPNYNQGIEIQNLNAAGTDIFSISGAGQISYAATSSGTVFQRGDWSITNTGGVTIVSDDNTANTILIAADTTDIKGVGFITANDSNKAIRDRGDIAWITGAGGSSPTVVQIRQEMDTNSAQFALIVADLLAMRGATFDTLTDSLESIRDRGDTAWTTGAGGSSPTVIQIRQEMDTNSTQFAQIITDIAAQNDFDPALDTVANVTNVAINADMRGTEGANTIAPDNAGIASILADTSDMQPKLGTPNVDISADIAAVKSDTALILVDTSELQGDWTNGGRLDVILDAINATTGTTGVVLTIAERDAIADAMLDRDMSIGTDTGSEIIRTVRQSLRNGRNRVEILAGVMTTYREDDTTVDWTAAVTTAPGDNISGIDPA